MGTDPRHDRKSREELLDVEYLSKLFGPLTNKLTSEDMEGVLARAKQLTPAYLRCLATEQATRRQMTNFFHVLEGACAEARDSLLKIAPRESDGLPTFLQFLRRSTERHLNELESKVKSCAHSSFRGLQDAFSGILSGELAAQEERLNAEALALVREIRDAITHNRPA